MTEFNIKNVKTAEFASEETVCFEATLYVDGKSVGGVSNRGHGGPNSYSMNNDEYKKHNESIQTWAHEHMLDYYQGIDAEWAKESYANAVKEGQTYEREALDLLVGELLERWESRKFAYSFRRSHAKSQGVEPAEVSVFAGRVGYETVYHAVKTSDREDEIAIALGKEHGGTHKRVDNDPILIAV